MTTIKLDITDHSGNSLLTNKTSIDDEIHSIKSNIYHLKTFSDKLRVFFKQIHLAFRSIVPDLKSLNSWQIVILILYALFNVTFSILDFNWFLPWESKSSPLKWVNEARNGVPLWRRNLLCLSGISAFTNVLNVVLVIHGKISSYFWGILGAIFYGSYAFAYGYVGDAQLFLFFYLPSQFIGIFIWSKALDSQATTRVKSLTLSGWCLVIIFSGIFAWFFFYEIPFFSNLLTSKYLFEKHFLPHLLDAITNALSVMGECLLILCYWEQYIIWTLVNLMLIAMYSGLLETPMDINSLVVWIMLTINSSVGLYTWFSRWKNARPNPSTLANIKS